LPLVLEELAVFTRKHVLKSFGPIHCFAKDLSNGPLLGKTSVLLSKAKIPDEQVYYLFAVRTIDDAEIWLQGKVFVKAVEHPVCQPMEGTPHHLLAAMIKHRGGPGDHFPGCSSGEGEQQD
jgi:hypothetical protein